MPTLRPFRDYSEHDVINLYTWTGAVPVTKGTLVKVVGSGWMDTNGLEFQGSPGLAYNNTVSQRWGVIPKVAAVVSGEPVLGMLLYDVRELDENGEKLIFNPLKAAEMQAVPSGSAVPIVTKGMFLYSGIDGLVTGGAPAYASGGQITATNVGTTGAVGFTQVGKFLGGKNAQGWALIRLNCVN